MQSSSYRTALCALSNSCILPTPNNHATLGTTAHAYEYRTRLRAVTGDIPNSARGISTQTRLAEQNPVFSSPVHAAQHLLLRTSCWTMSVNLFLALGSDRMTTPPFPSSTRTGCRTQRKKTASCLATRTLRLAACARRRLIIALVVLNEYAQLRGILQSCSVHPFSDRERRLRRRA